MDTELADYLESCGAVGGIIKESYTAKFYKNKCEELVLENKKLSKSMHDLTMSFSHTTSDAETSLIKLTQKNKELQKKYDKLHNDNSDLRKQYQEEFQKQEYNTMVKEEQEELNSIGKDDENGNYQDIIEDLENANKELQGEVKELCRYKITADEFADVFVRVGELVENTNLPRYGEHLVFEFKKLKDDNVKLIDEIECMKSHSDMSEGEYEGELKDKETIVNYLKDELDKYKKLFDESKKENEKAKDIKGVVVNEDKTIITINGIELKIGDKFTTDNTEYILKEIYIGKSGKYSLRTDKITIRIGTKYIIGKEKITKE